MIAKKPVIYAGGGAIASNAEKELFELYKNTNKSLRQISTEINISVSSIFNTIKMCKRRIKNNIEEDYIDFLNKDYELIKKK